MVSILCAIIIVLNTFCILYHSDRYITREYKRLILTHSILAPCYGFSMSAGSAPVIIVPCLTGYTTALYSYTPFDAADVQMMIWGAFLSADLWIVTVLFLYRFSVLQPSSTFFSTYDFRKYCYWVASVFIIWSFCFIFFPLENDAYNKDECAKKFAVRPVELDFPSTRSFSIFSSGIWYSAIYIYTFIGIFVFGALPMCLSFYTYEALRAQTTNLSAQTLKKHRNLMKTLITQSVIQFGLVCVPVFLFIFIAYSDLPFADVMAHACIISVALSGFCGPAYILLSTKSYRNAFSFKRKQSMIQSTAMSNRS